MCLGLIATIAEIWDEGGVPMALVDDGRERNPVCLLYVPDAGVGDSVVVHLGFAVQVLDPGQASEAQRLRREMGL